jgi:phosphohistidine phosphatase SixA
MVFNFWEKMNNLKILALVVLVFTLGLLSSNFIELGFDKKKPGQEPSTKTPISISELKNGGYIIFMRHTSRDKPWKNGVIEIENITLLDLDGACAPGSQLNEKGHKEVVALMETIESHKIPISEVYASPTCRTQQMAKAMFGNNYRTTDALYYVYLRDPRRHKYYNEAFRDLITKPVPKGTNRLLISHNRLLDSKVVGFNLSLKQGGTAIFKPSEDTVKNQRSNFLGVIPKGSWIKE